MKTFRSLAVMSLIAASASLAGCASNDDVSYSAISRHPSPEMQSLANRPIDADRNLSVGMNTNWRSMHDDLNRAIYTDHPSRLSAFPVMSTTGNPR